MQKRKNDDGTRLYVCIYIMVHKRAGYTHTYLDKGKKAAEFPTLNTFDAHFQAMLVYVRCRITYRRAVSETF